MADKFIINPTGSFIRYLGVPVPANGSFQIPLEKYPAYATYQKLINDVTDGTVSISKDGTTSLSIADGLKYLTTVWPAETSPFDNTSNGFSSSDVQAAIEEVATGNIGLTIGRTFYRSGNPGNKWLRYHEDTSDDVPAVIPFNCRLVALSFTNDNDDADVGVEIYKNGTRVFDWTLRDVKSAYKTNNLSSVTFLAGDKLAVFIDDEGSNGNDAIVVIELVVTSNVVGEG